MEHVRIYEMPACKMVSSEPGMFGDGKLERFDAWFSTLPRTLFPKDFLWFDSERGGFVWYYIYSEGMEVPDSFPLVEFPGGLYAVVSDIDGKDNAEAFATIRSFIEEKGCFEEDSTRQYLGNVITPSSASEAMGYNQMDYYFPIKVTKESIS